MARKLNSEERQEFIESLQNPNAATGENAEDAWAQRLVQKRDKPLSLTPELEEWFNKEFPSEFGF